jgi:hypothetical protein
MEKVYLVRSTANSFFPSGGTRRGYVGHDLCASETSICFSNFWGFFTANKGTNRGSSRRTTVWAGHVHLGLHLRFLPQNNNVRKCSLFKNRDAVFQTSKVGRSSYASTRRIRQRSTHHGLHLYLVDSGIWHFGISVGLDDSRDKMAESLESTFFQAQWPIWWRALRTFVSCMLFAVLIDQSGHLIPCVGQSEMIWHPCQVLQRSGYMYSGQHTLQSMKIPAGDERVGVVCEQRLGSTRSPLHFHLRCPMPARCFRRGRLGGRRQATSTELGSLSKWIRRSRIAIKDVNWCLISSEIWRVKTLLGVEFGLYFIFMDM